MAAGFKVADGYVEVHARYDKGELRKAAQSAADGFDEEFGKTHEKSHVIAKSTDRQVDKDRNLFQRIGQKIGARLFGPSGAMRGVAAFGRNFVEAITFGQADFGKIKTSGIAKVFGALGTAAGAIMAAALVAEIGNAITALLPIALGGALLAVPIADLIFRNVDLEKGKLKFKKNDVGQALKGFIRQAQQLADAMGKVFQGPFITGLRLTTQLMQGLEKPLTKAIKAITPGAMALWKGFLGGIVAFGKAFAPALPGINAGLKTWGQEFPKIGKALGTMFADILKDPAAVSRAIKDFSETLQLLARALGVIVPLLSTAAHWFHMFGGLPQQINSLVKAFKSLAPVLSQAWSAIKTFVVNAVNSIKTAFSNAWTSLKTHASNAWNSIKATVKAGIAAVKAVLVSVLNSIASVWKAAWNNKFVATLRNALGIIKDLWKLTAAAVKSVIGTLLSWAKAAWTKGWNAVKSATASAWKAIKSAVTTALNAIKALFAPAVSFMKSKLSAGWSAIKSATSSAWNAVKSVIKSAWTQISSAVSAGISKMVSLVRTIKGKVTGALAGAGTWLFSAGKQIIQGLLNGINSMINAVRSKLQALTALIKASKGPPEKDKVLLYGSGQLLMEGLMKGIDSRTGKLQSQLGGLTNKIPSMAGGGGGSVYNQQSSWSPTIIVQANGTLNSLDASGKRTLTKELFLALEQYRKDYVR